MPTPHTLVRPATFADAHPIYQLIKSNPDNLLPRSISNILFNTDRFLVAQSQQTIIGTIAWTILPELDPTKNPSFEIQSLCVAPSHRKQGVGRRLLTTALHRILPFQPQQIIVLTFFPAFFQKFGFSHVDKHALVYKLYQGCLLCPKYESPFTCPEIAMALNPQNHENIA